MQTWLVTLDLSTQNLSEDATESLGMDLVSRGALGAYASSPGTLCFFISSELEPSLESILAITEERYSYTKQLVEEKNWTQECKEMLQSLTVGEICIQPVQCAEDVPAPKDRETLYLIPGLGFGTGHHETTKNVVSALQHDKVASILGAPGLHEVMDVGTGSGILAIACAQLYNTNITAIDIDEAALENARENASLNDIRGTISFSSTPIANIPGSFEVIIANIYAEVLITMEQYFYDHLDSGRILILSGIMQSRRELIEAHFSTTRWEPAWSNAENNWVTLLLVRK